MSAKAGKVFAVVASVIVASAIQLLRLRARTGTQCQRRSRARCARERPGLLVLSDVLGALGAIAAQVAPVLAAIAAVLAQVGAVGRAVALVLVQVMAIGGKVGAISLELRAIFGGALLVTRHAVTAQFAAVVPHVLAVMGGIKSVGTDVATVVADVVPVLADVACVLPQVGAVFGAVAGRAVVGMGNGERECGDHCRDAEAKDSTGHAGLLLQLGQCAQRGAPSVVDGARPGAH
jgi:hypothetical protein